MLPVNIVVTIKWPLKLFCQVLHVLLPGSNIAKGMLKAMTDNLALDLQVGDPEVVIGCALVLLALVVSCMPEGTLQSILSCSGHESSILSLFCIMMAKST